MNENPPHKRGSKYLSVCKGISFLTKYLLMQNNAKVHHTQDNNYLGERVIDIIFDKLNYFICRFCAYQKILHTFSKKTALSDVLHKLSAKMTRQMRSYLAVSTSPVPRNRIRLDRAEYFWFCLNSLTFYYIISVYSQSPHSDYAERSALANMARISLFFYSVQLYAITDGFQCFNIEKCPRPF